MLHIEVLGGLDEAAWSADAKRSIGKLLRSKGGPFEIDYARLLSQNKQFLSELRKCCRHRSGAVETAG
jgi:hypothetical protein